MSTEARPKTPNGSKPHSKTNGKPFPPEPRTDPRVRGASGEVAVKIKTATYEKLVESIPAFENGLQQKTGFTVRLSPGALLDWIVKHRPEFLKP
jgi:hypothetical protein